MPPSSHCSTARPRWTSTPSFSSALRACSARSAGKAGSRRGPCLDQDDARLGRVDDAELVGQRPMRHLGDRARHLDAGRRRRRSPRRSAAPCAPPHRRWSRRARTPAGCAGGYRWRPRSSSGPVRTSPSRRARNRRAARRSRRSGGRTAHRGHARDCTSLRCGIDAGDARHQHAGVLLPAEDGADRDWRSPPATAPRSRPGRAGAGTDDSCAGRSPPRRTARCAALWRRIVRRTPRPGSPRAAACRRSPLPCFLSDSEPHCPWWPPGPGMAIDLRAEGRPRRLRALPHRCGRTAAPAAHQRDRARPAREQQDQQRDPDQVIRPARRIDEQLDEQRHADQRQGGEARQQADQRSAPASRAPRRSPDRPSAPPAGTAGSSDTRPGTGRS